MQGSEKWLNNQRINLMKKAIYYISFMIHFAMETVNFRLSYLERIWFLTLTRSMKCWYNFIFGAKSKLSWWHSFGFLNGCSIQQPRKWYEYKWDLDDEITLRAAAEIFNIEFVIISILRRAAKANNPTKLCITGWHLFGTLCGESWGILRCS